MGSAPADTVLLESIFKSNGQRYHPFHGVQNPGDPMDIHKAIILIFENGQIHYIGKDVIHIGIVGIKALNPQD